MLERGGQAQLGIEDGALIFPGVFEEPEIVLDELDAGHYFGELAMDGAPGVTEIILPDLLGNAAMSADAITAALAAAPKAAPAAEKIEGDPETAGREEMKKALAEAGGNSSIDARSGGNSGAAAASTDALWAKAISRVCPTAAA